jgi:hypothetical protein
VNLQWLDVATELLLFSPLFAFAVTFYFLAYRHKLGSRRYRRLSHLAADVTRATSLKPEHRNPDELGHLDELGFVGSLRGGRRATLRFWTEGGTRRHRHHWARLAVRADDAPKLAIRRETLGDKLARKLNLAPADLEIGDPEFDAYFHVEGEGDRARAVGVLRAGLARLLFDLFAAHGGVREVSLRNGELAVVCRREVVRFLGLVQTGDLQLEGLTILFDLLDRAARPFDRQKLHVKVLGGDRFAIVADGHTRCAYCHDAIKGDELDLVACERCSTVLHKGCLDENRRCPILGCAADGKARPARAEKV